jgi:hypothetical protein
MFLEEITKQIPTVTTVIGETWLNQNRNWAEGYISSRLSFYKQLEADLTIITQKAIGRRSIMSYRDPLHDKPNIFKAIYEIHGAALLAAAASKIELHVPQGDSGGKNFDIRADIAACSVNAECKTRTDNFPFNFPKTQEGPGEVPGHFASRATVDPHDATELGLGSRENNPPDYHYDPIPESTRVRQILIEGISQLPDSGCNLILLGQIAGDREDVERALYGAEVCDFITNLETKETTSEWRRIPTGAFGRGKEGEAFHSLSGVLWFRLSEFNNSFGRFYEFYQNPNATMLIPLEVSERLQCVISQMKKEIVI